MLKAFKYRLYPTKQQSTLLNKHIGASRLIYNLALDTKKIAYSYKINLSKFDLIKQLPELKKECEWLREINSQSLYQPITNLDTAYTNFFKGRGKFPKFKKKSSKGSFNIPQNVKLEKGKLVIPKFKEGIELVLHRPIKGTIRQATISKTPTGKYFVSILCETGEALAEKKPIKEETTVGIDLGLKTYLVTSEGKEYDNPKFLRKAQGRLKFIQRRYSKYKGGRTRQRLAKLHEKVANQRRDFLHKTSSELLKNHDSLAFEDLAVSNMIKNHNLALSISDAGWGMFLEMVKYKADWGGKNVLQIGRFEPSSKTCSCCGYVEKEMPLWVRQWTCPSCGVIHDRDKNAAINIKNFSLRKILSGTDRKTHDELPSMEGAMTHEAHLSLANG